MANAWMVRAGQGGYVFESFLSKCVIAIGWGAVPDLSSILDREELRKIVESSYPDSTAAQRRSILTQVATFRFDIKRGDIAVCYNPSLREYHLGTVQTDYLYAFGVVEDHSHVRRVVWETKVSRDSLSLQTRNTLGAIQTVFSLNSVIEDLRKPDNHGENASSPLAETPQTDMEALRLDVIGRSHEFIKDKVQSLSWEEMQELVSGLLRAMGYQTKVSPPGSDRGKDIIASPDGLGLEHPRIRVEVKHRPRESMSAPAIRSFLGGLRQDDRGVYVSTGGFTREAHYEAERAQFPITLVDLDDLVSLITQHYQKLDMTARAMIPLVQVYWPAS